MNTAIWLGLGIAGLLRTYTHTITQLVVTGLMFGNAAAMLLAGLSVTRRLRLAYPFGLALLAVNILLTFTDQFGILDLITLLIDLAMGYNRFQLGSIPRRLFDEPNPRHPRAAAGHPIVGRRRNRHYRLGSAAGFCVQ